MAEEGPTAQVRHRHLSPHFGAPPPGSALHAAQESSIAQVLGRHLERLLDGDLNVADLTDVLRLNNARLGSVKLVDRFLTQEQRQDAAVGPTRDRAVKR